MAYRVVRGVARSGKRRATLWTSAADVTATTALASQAAVLHQSFSGGVDPITVVRTRGNIWYGTDQAGTSESYAGAIGMCVVSDQAAAIGVTAIPTPITDAESDMFFVHEYFAQRFVVGDATGLNQDGLSRTSFDSKAMRKVNPDETICVVVENAFSVGLIFLVQFRMLLKVT